MKTQNIFVYVACGDDVHIETLNFSLKYLRHFSKNEIIVVTDTSRNNIKIEHDHIIDIETPSIYNHHQASIYLKTGLHKFLDMKFNYCYIDTDVIALDVEVDNIFNCFASPITFASDHCPMPEFSPYATKCNCNTLKKEKYALLDELQLKFNPNLSITDPFLKEKSAELLSTFYHLKKNPFSYLWLMIRYFLSYRIFQLNSDFYYNKKKKIWYYNNDEPVIYSVSGYYRKIEKESIFRWNRRKEIWLDDKGENAYIAVCNHLAQQINQKFGIEVKDPTWHHWNGGVFLFNEQSVDFLETWHNMTLDIFEDPQWVTRDQGTLIATVWKFGLNDHPRLRESFNFIADYYKKNISYQKQKGFTTNHYKTVLKPHFIHIYHEFGRKGWSVWDAIETWLDS